MTLKEKRQKEQDDLKNGRIAHILGCAMKLFSEDGIDTVTMDDIAASSEIGVASLYRYFKTKEELAIQCAAQSWQTQEKIFAVKFGEESFRRKNGLGQLEDLFSIFCDLYETDPAFYRFIYYFDSFVHRTGVGTAQLGKYEERIKGTKEVVTLALEKGFADGSIRKDYATKEGAEELYYTLTHSLFALAQKLSLSGEMLMMDKDVSAIRQLKTLGSLLIDSLRNKE